MKMTLRDLRELIREAYKKEKEDDHSMETMFYRTLKDIAKKNGGWLPVTHETQMENVESIREQGIKDIDHGIYLFVGWHDEPKWINTGNGAIIQAYIPESEIQYLIPDDRYGIDGFDDFMLEYPNVEGGEVSYSGELIPPLNIENYITPCDVRDFSKFVTLLNKYVRDSRSINAVDRQCLTKMIKQKISEQPLRQGLTLERVSSTMPGEVGDVIRYDLVSFTKVSLSSGENAGHIGWKYSDTCMMRIDNPMRGYEIDYGSIRQLFDASDEQEVILTGDFRIVDKVMVTEPGTKPQYGYKVPMFILEEV